MKVPVPFGVKSIPIFESPPDARKRGLFPVAALLKVNSFTADVVVVKIISSLPFPSFINPPFTNFGSSSVLFARLSTPDKVAKVPVVGNVTFVVAVEVRVIANAPDVIREDPFASVRVALVAGAVIVTLFIEVAVATPRIGVINVGVSDNTTSCPVPVVV